MTSVFDDGWIRLPDGRRLSFRAFGDGAGEPLVWIHGTPGSRLCAPPRTEELDRLGLRAYVFERPGYGLSDPSPGRTLLGFAEDLDHATRSLGLTRFALAGVSGAGPYLAACGAKISQRITRLAFVAAAGPVADAPAVRAGLSLRRRAMFQLARAMPALVRRALYRYRDRPEELYRELTRDAPPCDQAVLSTIWDEKVAGVREALRQGVDAFAEDLRVVASPWGFSPRDVRVETFLWHGHLDRATPLAMGKYMAAAIRGCVATYVPDAGHFLAWRKWDEILSVLFTNRTSRL